MAIECGGANFRFADPNETCFASGASFSMMELGPNEQPWTGGVDAADAFYNSGLPVELRRTLRAKGEEALVLRRVLCALRVEDLGEALPFRRVLAHVVVHALGEAPVLLLPRPLLPLQRGDAFVLFLQLVEQNLLRPRAASPLPTT